jgi:hypothetical protein
MVWFHVDDAMAFHPKAIEAGNAAIGLWVRAGAWATSARSDGFIPRPIARRIGTRSQIESLITAGLWEVKDSGYIMHDWHDYQIAKADIESRRESNRNRKREQRKRQNVTLRQPTRDTPVSHIPTVTPDVTQPSSCVRAGPLPSPPLGGWVGNATHHADDPRPPPPCQKHPNGPKHNEPCRECQQTRQYDEYTQLKHAETLRQFWEDVERCDDCTPKGWIKNSDPAGRCPNHDWTTLI